jgi:nucleotide-binding universal stress UspA family protein
MLAIRTILHPTDFGEPSHSAWHFAASLAACYGANLVLLHVIPTPLASGDDAFADGDSDARELSPHDGTNGNRAEFHRPEAGNPAEEILQIAQTCHADLIVMGSHGRRGLHRLVMGHVTEQVLLGATCPVLTVTIPDSATHLDQPKHCLSTMGR